MIPFLAITLLSASAWMPPYPSTITPVTRVDPPLPATHGFAIVFALHFATIPHAVEFKHQEFSTIRLNLGI